MRKFWILFVCLFTVSIGLFADNDRPIRFEQLPDKAKTFIRYYFSQEKVALVKMDNDFFDKNYEVIFISGSRIEFDKKGIWIDVDCKM